MQSDILPPSEPGVLQEDATSTHTIAIERSDPVMPVEAPPVAEATSIPVPSLAPVLPVVSAPVTSDATTTPVVGSGYAQGLTRVLERLLARQGTLVRLSQAFLAALVPLEAPFSVAVAALAGGLPHADSVPTDPAQIDLATLPNHVDREREAYAPKGIIALADATDLRAALNANQLVVGLIAGQLVDVTTSPTNSDEVHLVGTRGNEDLAITTSDLYGDLYAFV